MYMNRHVAHLSSIYEERMNFDCCSSCFDQFVAIGPRQSTKRDILSLL